MSIGQLMNSKGAISHPTVGLCCAFFCQSSQDAGNADIPNGVAISFANGSLVSSYNNISGLTVNNAPTSGNAFYLPAGLFFVDFEYATSVASTVGVFTSATLLGTYELQEYSLVGSVPTGTTNSWIHGRALVAGNQYFIIAPNSTSGPNFLIYFPGSGTAEYIARLSILQIA